VDLAQDRRTKTGGAGNLFGLDDGRKFVAVGGFSKTAVMSILLFSRSSFTFIPDRRG